MVQANIKVPKSGYLYIWISNDSEVPVYFDDLAINHRAGPLLQEDDYYPFGLEMKMLGSKAAGKQENKLKYNGKELQSGEFADGSGLDWYDYGARTVDVQIGRMGQIDPMAGTATNMSYSPYSYCVNNPINLIDPDGRNWTVSSATDNDGNTTVTFKFTGAVYNQSSKDYSKKMGTIVNNIRKSIEEAFKGGDGKLSFKTEADIRSIDKESDLRSDENIIRISDNVQDEDGEVKGVTGKADLFGRESFIGTSVADDIYQGKDKTTVPHEIGHNGGLLHPDYDNSKNGTRDKSNFFTNYLLGLWQKGTGQISPANGRADGKNWTDFNLMYSGNNNLTKQNQLNLLQFRALQYSIQHNLTNQNTVDNKLNSNLVK